MVGSCKPHKNKDREHVYCGKLETEKDFYYYVHKFKFKKDDQVTFKVFGEKDKFKIMGNKVPYCKYQFFFFFLFSVYFFWIMNVVTQPP